MGHVDAQALPPLESGADAVAAAITRLVGAVLLEQDEHWQLEGRRMFSAESMADIPALEVLPAQACLQEATA